MKSRCSKEKHTIFHFNFFILIIFAVLLIIGISIAFWNKYPSGDFPGNISLFLMGKNLLKNPLDIFLWSNLWFAGFPMTFISGRILFYLTALPFTYYFSEVDVLKTFIIFSHIVSAFGMFLFIYSVVSDWSSSLAGGLIYAIHPVHIYISKSAGYYEISWYYAFLPLLFFFIRNVLVKKNINSIILSALFLLILFMLSAEMVFVTLPFLFVYIILEMAFVGKTNIKSSLVNIFYTFILFLCFSAFLWLPEIFEIKLINFFLKEHIEWGIRNFVISNPLSIIDGTGILSKTTMHLYNGVINSFDNHFYLGLSLVLFILASLILLKCDTKKRIRYYFLFFLFFFVFVNISLSFGVFSPYEKIRPLIKFFIFEHTNPVVYLFMFLSFIFIILLIYLFKLKFLVFIIFCLMFIFISPFSILRTFIPIYKNMRSPEFFYILMPIFGLSVLVSFSFLLLKGFLKDKPIFKLLLVLLSLLIFFDFISTREQSSSFVLDKNSILKVKEVYASLCNDDSIFRVMSYEGYNPYLDFGASFAKVPNLRPWLNWTSAKWDGSLNYYGIYRNLRNGNFKQAGKIAGLFNVKYLFDYLQMKPNLVEGEFSNFMNKDNIRVYNNANFKPFIQFYTNKVFHIGDSNNFTLLSFLTDNGFASIEIDSEKSLKNITERDRANLLIYEPEEHIRFSDKKLINILKKDFGIKKIFTKKNLLKLTISPAKESGVIVKNFKKIGSRKIHLNVICDDGVLVVSESFYPNWKVIVDGVKKEPLRVNYAFLGTEVSRGEHKIEFIYSIPWYFIIGWIISGGTIILLLIRGLFKLLL